MHGQKNIKLHIYVFINANVQFQNTTSFLVHSASYSTVATCTMCSNNKALYVLPTQCIYVSNMAVKTDMYYFPIEQLLLDPHSDEALKFDVFTAI